MPQLSLNASQIARLAPIKAAGGYRSDSAVVAALIAIYADDLLSRVLAPPNTALLPSTTTQLSPNTTPLSPSTTPPITTQLPPNTPPSPPTATPSAPKRTKFDL
jgi:hypothetical protein